MFRFGVVEQQAKRIREREAAAQKVIESKYMTPQQFQEKYGVKPNIPKEATITKVEKTAEGYQIQYHTPTDWREGTFTGKVFSEIERREGEMIVEKGHEAILLGRPYIAAYMGAGVLGVGEAALSTAEIVARSLATIPTGKPRLVPAETIRAPPTPTGAAISGVAGLITGVPSEEVRTYQKMMPHQMLAYGVGGIVGFYGEVQVTSFVGKKIFEGVKKLPLVKKAVSKAGVGWERKVVEPVMKRMPRRVQKSFYGAEYAARITEREILWETKGIPPQFIPSMGRRKEWLEFATQIERQLPTRPLAKKWYVVTKGARITPMKTTLERAMFGKLSLGGLAAGQQIQVTQVAKRALLRPERLVKETIRVKVRAARLANVLTTGIAVSPKVLPLLIQTEKQIQVSVQRQKQLQRLGVRQVQRSIQHQRQVLRQQLRFKQIPPRQITTIRKPYIPRERKRRGREAEMSLLAKWYAKKHPVPTGLDVAKFIFG